MGQAAALQMIDAGTRLHFQHYRPLNYLLTNQPWCLLFLGAQTVLVAAGFRGVWSPLCRWLTTRFRPWQLAVVALGFVLTSATVSPSIPFYAAELLFAACIQTVNLANLILAARSLPQNSLPSIRARLEKWFAPAGPFTRAFDRFGLAAALWVAVIAATLSAFSYQRHPHIPDEVVYLYHARYFAAGTLTLPAPPVQPAFNIDLMNYEAGYWFCPVPPGWPAILALGVLAGVPWLVNPLLGGLSTLLAYILLGELYGRRTARISTLLLCLSPWHLFMSMNLMTHTLTLALALLAGVAVVYARRTGKVAWGLAAGLACGFSVLVRPLEGVTLGCLIGLWILGAGGRRLKLASIAAFALGGLLMAGAALHYNRLLTGDPLKFPIMAYTDKYYGPNSNALGFGPDRGLGWPIDPFPGHGPLDALVNSNLNFFSINIELFGWSTGSLLLMLLYVFSARPRGPDLLMLAVIAAIYGVHFFYYFSGGPDFGARYWFLMLAPLVVMTVRGLDLLVSKLDATAPGAGTRALAVAIALCGFALVNYIPWRAVDKYHHYENMRPDVRSLARKYNFGRSLVLVRGNRHPDYASAATYNPLDFEAAAPIYAWDRSPEVRTQVLKVYSDRPVWILEGPTITKDGFRVAAGPLAASELLAAAKGQASR